MVDNDQREELLYSLRRDINDGRVLDAMSRIRREYFVPLSMRKYAYEDRPLPIGHDQTISQPYIIALMTQALELKGTETVLELGTGSGYQTAILAELSKKVVTVERIASLSDKAERLLKTIGYTNIEFHIAGETLGWPPGAPYDAILVTAAAPHIPEDLVHQLAENGRMILPVGPKFEQILDLVVQHNEGIRVRNLGRCRFVPLIGKDAWND